MQSYLNNVILLQLNTEFSAAISKPNSNNIILEGFRFKDNNNSFPGFFKYLDIKIKENLLLSPNYTSLGPDIINVEENAKWNISPKQNSSALLIKRFSVDIAKYRAT